MLGFRLAKRLLVFAFASFTIISVSSPTQACMGCMMAKSPDIVLSFSPDGKLLASFHNAWWSSKPIRKVIKLWQMPKMKMVKQLQEGQNVVSLAFSPDGKILAAGGFGNWVSLWRLPEGRRIMKLTVKAHQLNRARCLSFSPDGRLLAAGTGDGEIYLWQIPQGKLLAILPTGKSSLIVTSLAFSPDSKKLAAVFEDGRYFQLWDVNARKLLWEQNHSCHCYFVAFTKDGSKLVGAGYYLVVMSAIDGKAIKKFNPSTYGYSPPGGVSADGQFAAFYDRLGSVKVVRTSDFKVVWRGSILSWKLKSKLYGWADAVEKESGLPATRLFPNPRLPFASGFAFSRDNRFLALGFSDGQIKLWRIR
ncbi:MAG: hypothetical protein NZ805_03440 [Armatimonadetes bacterium]|nr:hypothetical protein [Armatimonadota bacterium]